MKKLIILLSILATTMVAQAKDSFFKEQDKVYHFWMSHTIASVSYIYFDDKSGVFKPKTIKPKVWYKTPEAKAFSVCMAVGLGKELYDEWDYNGFDTRDLYADAAGCMTGVYFTSVGLSGLAITKNWLQYNVKF